MDDIPQLLRRWQEGDPAAGDALLRACFEPLHRFFRTKIGEGIDDLIQKTLMSCVEAPDKIRDPEAFWAYLFSVARNRLYDRLRSELRVGEKVALSEMSLHELGASPSSIVAQGQRAQLVAEALRRIPLDYQIALELSYWEGMKAPQIGQVLQVNPNTVRTRLVRARAALKAELGKLGAAELGEGEALPS